LEYTEKNGIDPKNVEWLSQALPTSVCDIKTVRGKGDKIKDHFLEVKSTKLSNFNNVYISSRQIKFFEENPNSSIFVFVKFNELMEPIETNYFTIEELKRTFDLNPIKFRLKEK